MKHRSPQSLLALVATSLVLVACGDLTQVPKPPVALSALETSPEYSADGEGPVTPRATVRLVRAIAPHSLVAVHLPDIGGTITRFKKTGLYKLLRSKELKEALGGDIFASFNLGSVTMNGKATPESHRLAKALTGSNRTGKVSFGRRNCCRVLGNVGNHAASLRRAGRPASDGFDPVRVRG